MKTIAKHLASLLLFSAKYAIIGLILGLLGVAFAIGLAEGDLSRGICYYLL